MAPSRASRTFVWGVLILASLVVGGVGLGVWWMWPWLRAGRDMFHHVEASQQAKGADSVRALGCLAAGAFDYDVGSPEEQSIMREAHRKGLRRWVWCTRPKGAKITCEAVARAYLRAVPDQPGPFVATVAESSGPRSTEDICSIDFEADGSPRE